MQYSKPENFLIFVISNNESFISKNLRVKGPLGGKFEFFSLSGFDIQSDYDYKHPHGTDSVLSNSSLGKIPKFRWGR